MGTASTGQSAIRILLPGMTTWNLSSAFLDPKKVSPTYPTGISNPRCPRTASRHKSPNVLKKGSMGNVSLSMAGQPISLNKSAPVDPANIEASVKVDVPMEAISVAMLPLYLQLLRPEI